MATTFTNQATLTYNGSTVRSNVAVGVMESSLTVSKNAVAEQYSAGEDITYVVSIVNNADVPATGLTVNDNLGAYPFDGGTVQPLTYVDGSVQYYVNGALQAAPAVSTAAGLSITGITVPAQGNAVIIYSTSVNEYAPLAAGSEIVNTVDVGGSEKITLQAQQTVAADESAQLSFYKSVSPVPVTENGQLTYTLLLTNTGNTAVTNTDGAIISDTFDPVLTGISVALDGTPLTPTDYSYSETTGVFATAAGVITVPAATYTQDPVTGAWSTVPGTATLTVAGTVGTI